MKKISHLENIKLTHLVSDFKNASLVNNKGELLFSKDGAPFKTTTSRLVLFQICKKYFSFNVGDVFICNDPQNGGTSNHRVYFIGCLNPNLYLIWDDEFLNLDIKIPPTPLVEKFNLNEFILSALLQAQPEQIDLKNFFLEQIEKFTNLKRLQTLTDSISLDSYQKEWFKVSEQIFKAHFDLKSLGNSELKHIYKNTQFKLNIDIIEKQNQKQIKIDFSGLRKQLANPSENVQTTTDEEKQNPPALSKESCSASLFSAASHVVESGLLIEISKFYNIEKYLSQSVLDHIRLVLPPNSPLSTTHPTGEHNFEIQKMTRQYIRHVLNQINTTSKNPKPFKLYSTYLMHFSLNEQSAQAYLSNSRIHFTNLKLFSPENLNCIENLYKGCLKNTSDKSDINIKVMGVHSEDDAHQRWIKKGNMQHTHSNIVLKSGEEIEFNWKT